MAYFIRKVKDILPSFFLWKMEKIFSFGLYKKQYQDNDVMFVHIPKNAGVFINGAIYGKDHLGHNSLVNVNAYDPGYFFSKYKVCLVRNPYDRLISAYAFLKQGGGDVGADPKYVKIVREFENINDFVCDWLAREDVLKSDYVLRPQTFFVYDGSLLVDEYFKLEELNFSILENKLKMKSKKEIDFSLSKRNKSISKGEKNCLNDDARSVIAEKYKKDFEVFEYDF